MMNNYWKRILSLALALVLTAGLLPVLIPAAKAVTATKDTLGTLLETTTSGTIVLTEDTVLSNGTYYVASGVTLLVPFNVSNQTVNSSSASYPYANAEQMSTTSAVSYPGNPKNSKPAILLKLENAELVVNGKLIVGGQYSSATGVYSGQTAGAFGQIELDDASKISVNGSSAVLSCVGYITGGTIHVTNGAKVYEPFVLTEHNGGTYAAVAYGTASVSPFSSYTMMNIQSTMTLDYGSSLYGYCDLYASSQHNITTALIIGSSNALYVLSNGSVTLSYSETWEDGTDLRIKTRNVVGRTSFDFSGDVYMGALTLDVGIKVSTDSVYFPIPYNFEIIQSTGTFTIPYDIEIKLMPGSQFLVKEGAGLTVESNGSLVVFDGTYPTGEVYGATYPYGSELSAAGYSERAKLIVNGTMTLKSSSLFAGKVESSGNTGKIIVGSNVTLNKTMVEGVYSGQSYLVFYKVGKTTQRSYPLTAQIVDHSQKYTEDSKLINMASGMIYYAVSEELLIEETSHSYIPYNGSQTMQNYYDAEQIEGTWSTTPLLYDINNLVTNQHYIDDADPTINSGELKVYYADALYENTLDENSLPDQGVVYVLIKKCDHPEGFYIENDINTHYFVCSNIACGAEVIRNHEWDYSDNRDGTHTKTCVCEKVVTESHTWGEYVQGENDHTRTCTGCDAVETRDHDWKLTFVAGQSYHTKSCADCGKSFNEDHSWTYAAYDASNHTKTCICGESVQEAHEAGVGCDLCNWGTVTADATKDQVVINGMSGVTTAETIIVASYKADTMQMVSCDVQAYKTGVLTFDLVGLEAGMTVKIFIVDGNYAPKADYKPEVLTAK